MGLDLLDALLGHRLEKGRLLGLLVPCCTSPWPARGVAAMGKTRSGHWYIAAACPETAKVLVAAYCISANLVLRAPSANEPVRCPVNSIDDRCRSSQTLAALKRLRISGSLRLSHDLTE